MRIATRTVYQLQTHQLGIASNDMTEKNKVVSTRKRINNLADDPVGLGRVLGFKSDNAFIEQIDKNIDNGKIWLEAGETSLKSVEDLTLEMKTLVSQLRTDSYEAGQRKAAIPKVDSILNELLQLANTKVMGHYIYGGDSGDKIPLVADNPDAPTTIEYAGSTDKYKIKISSTDNLDVSQVGSEIFWDEKVKVDVTNNKIDFSEFIEGVFEYDNLKTSDNLKEEDITITTVDQEAFDLPTEPGKPLKFEWDQVNSKWKVLNNPGYPIPAEISGTNDLLKLDVNNDGKVDMKVELTKDAVQGDSFEFELVPYGKDIEATIPEGEYTKEELAVAVGNALTEASEKDGYGAEYEAKFDKETGKYTIEYLDDSRPGYFKTKFLWESGENSGQSIAPDLGFDEKDAVFEPAISDNRVGKVIQTGLNDRLDFSMDGGTTTLSVTIPPGKYSNKSLAEEIEKQMKAAAADADFTANFDVKFNKDDVKFEFDASDTSLTAGDFQILWNTGPSQLGKELGFNPAVDDSGALEYSGTSLSLQANIVTGKNDAMDFNLGGTDYTIKIPAGKYSNDDLAVKIRELMEEATGGVGFDVKYNDSSHSFSIDATGTGAANFNILWSTGANASTSAAEVLGFNPTLDKAGALSYDGDSLPHSIDIVANVNDRINFKEIDSNGKTSEELSFTIPPGSYSGKELAAIIEEQMEKQSVQEGNDVDYTVSYDLETHQFKFRENGGKLNAVNFMWHTGEDKPTSAGGTGRSAATTLGFDELEDHYAVLGNTSKEEASWGLFETLIDMKTYLEKNDVEGLDRTITRLQYHFDQQRRHMTDIGLKVNRLEIKQSINSGVSFSITENRSKIEEADMVKAIMDLMSAQTSYNAALSSASKIMQLSLADYLK